MQRIFLEWIMSFIDISNERDKDNENANTSGFKDILKWLNEWI